MGKVVAITNQKGGVGKTTTAINLAASLALDGRRVLLIDIDPQGNASSGLGVPGDATEQSIYEVLIEELPIHEAVVPTGIERLDLVPAGQRLSGAEVELVGLIARESRLRDAVVPLRPEYDYVLVDCPPSLGLLTINTLTAADSVLVPLQCEYYALEGLSHLLQAIRLVQQRLNPALHMEGVLLTMYDGRLNLCQQVEDEARKYFAERVYRTVIPRNVRLSEAPSFGKPAVIYDPGCIGAASYRNLAREVIGNA
ncbi:MAG TPA: AAA family ATPase [Candidatus Saccharimonadales bacterium]|nr:AAA family ATPase [Candidatus Saccharimonadales bacterium]